MHMKEKMEFYEAVKYFLFLASHQTSVPNSTTIISKRFIRFVDILCNLNLVFNTFKNTKCL